MALTAREQQIIIEMSERQDQLELIIGSLIGGQLGKGAVSLRQELGDRKFGLNRSNTDKNLFVGNVAATARTKIKRKVSPYQREFGRQIKILKKKHPRTKISKLMKRAHTATKKVRRL
jgi:hypothetical protein